MISKGAVRVQKKNLWQDALYWVLLLAQAANPCGAASGQAPRPKYLEEANRR